MLAVELHAHTRASNDCLTRPQDLIRVCAERGLHRIAITDHNTIEGALEARALAPRLVIVGEEVMTTQGELLAYFVTEAVPPGLPPSEAIARLRAQGAAISVSHPFDSQRKGAWREADLRAIAPLVDAIEVFNARCLRRADNDRAQAFAQAHNLPGTIGSDAHSLREVGRAFQWLPRADSAGDLIAGWRFSQPVMRYSSPGVRLISRWAYTVKTLTRQRHPHRD